MKILGELESEGFVVSIRRLCVLLEVPRCQVYRQLVPRQKRYPLAQPLVERIRAVIDSSPY